MRLKGFTSLPLGALAATVSKVVVTSLPSSSATTVGGSWSLPRRRLTCIRSTS